MSQTQSSSCKHNSIFHYSKHITAQHSEFYIPLYVNKRQLTTKYFIIDNILIYIYFFLTKTKCKKLCYSSIWDAIIKCKDLCTKHFQKLPLSQVQQWQNSCYFDRKIVWGLNSSSPVSSTKVVMLHILKYSAI